MQNEYKKSMKARLEEKESTISVCTAGDQRTQSRNEGAARSGKNVVSGSLQELLETDELEIYLTASKRLAILCTGVRDNAMGKVHGLDRACEDWHLAGFTGMYIGVEG